MLYLLSGAVHPHCSLPGHFQACIFLSWNWIKLEATTWAIWNFVHHGTVLDTSTFSTILCNYIEKYLGMTLNLRDYCQVMCSMLSWLWCIQSRQPWAVCHPCKVWSLSHNCRCSLWHPGHQHPFFWVPHSCSFNVVHFIQMACLFGHFWIQIRQGCGWTGQLSCPAARLLQNFPLLIHSSSSSAGHPTVWADHPESLDQHPLWLQLWPHFLSQLHIPRESLMFSPQWASGFFCHPTAGSL